MLLRGLTSTSITITTSITIKTSVHTHTSSLIPQKTFQQQTFILFNPLKPASGNLSLNNLHKEFYVYVFLLQLSKNKYISYVIIYWLVWYKDNEK